MKFPPPPHLNSTDLVDDPKKAINEIEVWMASMIKWLYNLFASIPKLFAGDGLTSNGNTLSVLPDPAGPITVAAAGVNINLATAAMKGVVPAIPASASVFLDGTLGWSTPVVAAITDGDLTHSPDGNSVFDALALKAPLASPVFTGLVTAPTLTVTGLSNGYIPYHVSDAAGFADGPTKANVDSAVTLKHAAGSDFLVMQVFS
jgi:hypothetical protein